ncbi:SseB protein N-terminal domain-containing protein [Jatrophihabitans endophyticus]|uniref:SseB protein N-terminal domain-containing protein n=1 Tax=Jatrophihabitans endophyticus TaxID=1206085 RepID=A0A1M5LKG4_9ACTN|nr:SseB family protein [Jatrophihabitans endophyticus]SHG65531.1 SseB protein N-terminal domain-containing protein [Jatrophihabitans endophyticus]
MSSPTDIPGFGGGHPDPVDPSAGPDAAGGIRNDAVRAALDASAESPGPRTSVDILRHCLFGYLLLDVTGSEITVTDEGEVAPGSTISVRGGEGPDGQPAIFAYTSHDEIVRMYPPEGPGDGIEVQSLVQDAAGVLELARAQEAGWLYLDPAGPSAALAAEDIDFALRVPRNDAVRATLEPGVPRAELLAALTAEGPLSLAVIAPDVEPGVAEEGTQVQVRTVDAPELTDGAQALAVFTSGPEVVASAPEDRIATQTAADVVELAREGGFAGLLINPAGPWAYVSADELAGLDTAGGAGE